MLVHWYISRQRGAIQSFQNCVSLGRYRIRYAHDVQSPVVFLLFHFARTIPSIRVGTQAGRVWDLICPDFEEMRIEVIALD